MLNVSLYLLIIPMICYLVEAFIGYGRGDYAAAITFGAYSLANVGLIWRFLYT